MSEEVYIKAPCCECNGRVSLPLDAVGMDFNCPHCGAGLQMLLKHVCEHCNGKLSFDNSPEAIGAEVECGHCNKLTTLSPSTFSTESAEEESVPEPEDFLEETPEPESEEPESSAVEEESEGTEKPKRRGPPRPRSPRRGGGAGPPRPRPKKSARKAAASGPEAPAKIGRRLAGSGKDSSLKEDAGDQPKLKAPLRQGSAPKRSNKIESANEARAPSPRRMPSGDSLHPATELQGGDPMDPMSDLAGEQTALPQNSFESQSAPEAPAPVKRQVAGGGEYISPAGGTVLPQPTFQAIQQAASGSSGSSTPAIPPPELEDEQDGNESSARSLPKWAVFPLVVVMVLGFVYFLLPMALEVIDPMLAKKVRQYTRFQFDKAPRRDTSEDFQINHSATTISQLGNTNGTFYVTGSVENISSANYQQVELKIELYDGQGALLGETLDYTNQLGPNVTWNFKAACLLTNAASAKVIGVIARK